MDKVKIVVFSEVKKNYSMNDKTDNTTENSRDFRQIATAGADTVAGSKFSPKMSHCACVSVASSRSVKSD